MSTFLRISFSEDIHGLVNKALQESKNYEGIFTGNKEKGNFDFKALGGRFTGDYRVRGNVIEIVFKKKPILIPMALIETFLKQHIR